jgi:aryl-alcohol dehydrogenase-like predicted oxidoreductase
MTFGKSWGWGADARESRAQLDRFLDSGGNFIDTANNYTDGESEEILGELLRDRRDEVVLATKYTINRRQGDPNAGGNHRKSMVQALEASLRRLRSDAIDLYWVHVWDRLTPVEEVMRALDDLVCQGKVLYVGVSDFPAWKVAQANTLALLRGWTPFVALQIEYNLVRRDAERDLIPMAQDLGLAVLPWAPLAGGVLSGKYTQADIAPPPTDPEAWRSSPTRKAMVAPGLTARKLEVARLVTAIAAEIGQSPAQVALRWLLQRPGVVAPILGARTEAQLQDNLGALSFELDDRLVQRLDEASALPLGFPHDFIRSPFVESLVSGGVPVEGARG